MKNKLVRFVLVCAIMTLLSGIAMAADGITNATPSNNNVTFSDVQADSFKATVTGVADGQYFVLVTTSADPSTEVPTADNVFYLDQQAAASDGKAEFVIYPKEGMTTGQTYYVFLSSGNDSNFSALTQVGSFEYGGGGGDDTEYKLGDPDGDEQTTASDALVAMQMGAGLDSNGQPDDGSAWTQAQKTAADVDRDGGVTASDALIIMEVGAGLRTL